MNITEMQWGISAPNNPDNNGILATKLERTE